MSLPAQSEMRFDGETYEPELDKARLGNQVFAVLSLMLDGKWRTLAEIELDLCYITKKRYPQASLSARLRDLRKPRFGRYTVRRQRRGDGSKGVFEYRLTL